jgi:hypothetical protein
LSKHDEHKSLLSPETLGTWMIERWYIWQMRLLDARGLAKFSRERGIEVSSSSGKDIQRLWQLGLLRADYLRSSEELRVSGLSEVVGDADEPYLYADTRLPPARSEGWIGASAYLEELGRDVSLFFHPFRFYVVHSIFYPVFYRPRPNILPIGIFNVSKERYVEVVEKELEEFDEYTSSKDFLHRIGHLNDVVGLVIATEPCVFRRMFGTYQVPSLGPKELGLSAEEYLALGDQRLDRVEEFQNERTEEHRQELAEVYRGIGLERLEELRQQLCLDAERLDQDNNVLTLLRLTRGRMPLEIRDQVGAALQIRIMAEMLRRFSEEVFETELAEEDEMGFGWTPQDTKKDLYGSNRLLDGERNVANAYVRRLGLDYGIRVRWYVEGHSEWGALGLIFGRYGGTGVELHNLRARVTSKNRVNFESNLQTDLEGKVYSLVTIDGDRKDFVDAVRRAAREDRICGRFFIQEPDFEFANFSKDELEEIVWSIAEDNGAASEDKARLHSALQGADNGDQVVRRAKATLTDSLRTFGKGPDWGERLMQYALEHPENLDGRPRPIMEAIWTAQRGLQADFDYERTHFKVDPDTGELVER